MLLLMIAVALLGRARDHELLRQLYELRLGLPVGAPLHFNSFMENGQAGAAVGGADIHVAHIYVLSFVLEEHFISHRICKR